VVWTDFFLGIVAWRTMVRIVMPANPHPRCSDVFDVWLHRKVELDWSVDYGLAMWAAGRYVGWAVFPVVDTLNRRIISAIRDDNYLVGRRLQNRRAPAAAGPAAAAAAAAGPVVAPAAAR
jgi:hypothetical protein